MRLVRVKILVKKKQIIVDMKSFYEYTSNIIQIFAFNTNNAVCHKVNLFIRFNI